MLLIGLFCSLNCLLPRDSMSVDDVNRLRNGRLPDNAFHVGNIPWLKPRPIDTTEYRADQYEIAVDENADDLVTKFPGVTSFDGGLQASGREVDRVLVDGANFFWDDVEDALNNIPASIIDKVQIYNSRSEEVSFTDQSDIPSTKTINIITKRQRGGSYKGAIDGGFGFDKRYQGSSSINRFDSTLRASVLFAVNNVNDRAFGFSDQAQVLQSGMGFESGSLPAVSSSGAIDDMLSSDVPGIVQLRSLAAMVSNGHGPFTIGASYTAHDRTVDASTAVNRQFVGNSFVGEDIQQLDTSSMHSTSHSIRLHSETDFDTTSLLFVNANLQLNSGASRTQRRGVTVSSIDTLNSTSSQSQREVDGMDLHGQLRYVRRFSSPRRHVVADIGVQYSSANIIDALTSLGISGSQPDAGDTINQQGSRTEEETRFRPHISYVEPLTEQSDLRFAITAESSALRSDRYMRNAAYGSGQFTNVDTTLSSFLTQNLSHLGTSVVYLWSNLRTRFAAGVEYRQARLDGDSRFPVELSTTRHFRNLLPTVSLTFNDDDVRHVHFSYSHSADLPTIEQMQNVVDNSNPLMLTRGSPDLRQALRRSAIATFRQSLPGINGFASISSNYTSLSDYIGRQTDVAEVDTVVDGLPIERGVQVSRPINLQGAMMAVLSGSIGYYVDSLPMHGSFTIGVNYSRTPGVINGVGNEAISATYYIGANVDYDPTSYLSLTGGLGFRHGYVDNTTQVDVNNTFSNLSYSGEAVVTLPLDFELTVNVRSRDLDGLSGDFNRDVLLLNGSLEKTMFEGNRGSLRLSVRDALNQGAAVSRQFTDIYTEDRVAMVLRRVVLLTFSYRY